MFRPQVVRKQISENLTQVDHEKSNFDPHFLFIPKYGNVSSQVSKYGECPEIDPIFGFFVQK